MQRCVSTFTQRSHNDAGTPRRRSNDNLPRRPEAPRLYPCNNVDNRRVVQRECLLIHRPRYARRPSQRHARGDCACPRNLVFSPVKVRSAVRVRAPWRAACARVRGTAGPGTRRLSGGRAGSRRVHGVYTARRPGRAGAPAHQRPRTCPRASRVVHCVVTASSRRVVSGRWTQTTGSHASRGGFSTPKNATLLKCV